MPTRIGGGGHASARRTAAVVATAGAAVLACLTGSAGAVVGAARAPGTAAGIVSTIAGGVGGPAPARKVSIGLCGLVAVTSGCGVSFAGGHLYFTDLSAGNGGGLVRAVSLRTGRLTTPVGSGQWGLGGDGGPAAQAQTAKLQDVAVDKSANLLVVDGTRVRVAAPRSGTFYGQAMTAGEIYTVAGGGSSAQDGVPATAADIRPRAVLADHAGNIVIAGAHALRVVAATTGTFYGQAMTAGDIYTVAGGGSSAQDGVPATSAFMTPVGVAIDGSGNVLLADYQPGRVRVVAVTAGRFYGQAMTAGDIYTVAGGGSSKRDGVPARKAALFAFGIAVDHSGNLVAADITGRVRVVAVRTGRFYGQAMTAGDIYTVAGGGTSKRDGVLATSALLKWPREVAVDSAGNIVIANRQARLLRVVAARSGVFYGVRMRSGHLYVIAGNGQVWSSGGGGLAVRAQFFPDYPITFDRGNLVAASSHPTHRTLNTTIRLVPARSGTFFGRSMQAGHLYWIAGNPKTSIFSGNGGPARKAGLEYIEGLAPDAHANLVIASGFHILVVAARAGRFYGRAMRADHIYLIAGNGDFQDSGDGGPAVKAGINPARVSVDSNGNVVFDSNSRIRVIAGRTGTFYGIPMTAGDIYTIYTRAGGAARASGNGTAVRDARSGAVPAVALAGSGGVLFTEGFQIRMIATATGTFYGIPMTAGGVYTIAGTGNRGISSDGTPALSADMWPDALATDNAGNVIFYDNSTSAIRVIPATTGTYYGVSMIADHVYSITGGTTGSLGDGGPAIQATIGGVSALAANGSRLAFNGDNRVRIINR
jgi:hypothetical protein